MRIASRYMHGSVRYSCAMSNSRASAGGVQSVDRAISVLEILAQRGRGAVSPRSPRSIGVHKSTAFRLLGALEDARPGRAGRRPRQVPARLRHPAAGRRGGQPDGRHPAGPARLRTAGRGSRRDRQHRGACRTHYAVNVDQVRGPAAVSAHNWVGRADPAARHLQRQGPAGLPARKHAATTLLRAGRSDPDSPAATDHHPADARARQLDRPRRATATPTTVGGDIEVGAQRDRGAGPRPGARRRWSAGA